MYIYYATLSMDTAIQNMGRPTIGSTRARLVAVRYPEELIARVEAYAAKRGIKTAEAYRELLEHSLRLFDRAQERRKVIGR